MADAEAGEREEEEEGDARASDEVGTMQG